MGQPWILLLIKYTIYNKCAIISLILNINVLTLDQPRNKRRSDQWIPRTSRGTIVIPGLFFLIWQGVEQSLLANLAITFMCLVKGIFVFQQFAQRLCRQYRQS